MPLLCASLVRASKGGFTPQVIDALTMPDFWEWVDAFNRLAKMEQDAIDRALKKV